MKYFGNLIMRSIALGEFGALRAALGRAASSCAPDSFYISEASLEMLNTSFSKLNTVN